MRSTRPLQLGGTIVRDLEMRFEGGDAVEVRASSGADAVRGQMSVDEYAKRLGEVALVDGESRVGQTGITFYDTLFDENATCHIAYGAGVTFGIDGLDGLTPDELRERGINNSGGPHGLHDRRPRGRGRRDHEGRRLPCRSSGRTYGSSGVDRRAARALCRARGPRRCERRRGPDGLHRRDDRACPARAGADPRRVRAPARATSTSATRDQHVRRAMIEFGPDEALEHTPDWLKTRFRAHAAATRCSRRPATPSPTCCPTSTASASAARGCAS